MFTSLCVVVIVKTGRTFPKQKIKTHPRNEKPFDQVTLVGKRKCTCFMSKFIDYEEMIEMPNLMKYGLSFLQTK